jgi:hypothetical protein
MTIVVADEELAERLRVEIGVMQRRLSMPYGAIVDKKLPISEREAEVWKVEAEAAIRVVEWFDLLVKLRRAADTVQPDKLIAAFRDSCLALLEHDRLWLMQLLSDRFAVARDKLELAKKSSSGGKTSSAPRQEGAEKWQARIKPEVKRLLKAGRSNENIGALLAANAERDAGTVADFAAEVRASKK